MDPEVHKLLSEVLTAKQHETPIDQRQKSGTLSQPLPPLPPVPGIRTPEEISISRQDRLTVLRPQPYASQTQPVGKISSDVPTNQRQLTMSDLQGQVAPPAVAAGKSKRRNQSRRKV
jgi:hypothetical protein